MYNHAYSAMQMYNHAYGAMHIVRWQPQIETHNHAYSAMQTHNHAYSAMQIYNHAYSAMQMNNHAYSAMQMQIIFLAWIIFYMKSKTKFQVPVIPFRYSTFDVTTILINNCI